MSQFNTMPLYCSYFSGVYQGYYPDTASIENKEVCLEGLSLSWDCYNLGELELVGETVYCNRPSGQVEPLCTKDQIPWMQWQGKHCVHNAAAATS